MEGIVYKSTGSWYLVKSEGLLYKCRIKGKFRIKGIKSTNPIAVGDRVSFSLETKDSQTTGTINYIGERKNFIVRKSVNLSKQTHIIAANIDRVFLLITIDNPQTTNTFIDRFLVTTQAYSVETILVFNKIDSYKEEEKFAVSLLKSVYEKIGYKCLEVSATQGLNTDIIESLIEGKVSLFVGNSGVGKSTLINAIAPWLNLKTRSISEQYKQGRHTTTFAEMFDIDDNTQIIDTPGIKGFGVVDMEPDEVGDYFVEFFALKKDCKFYNCIHVNEPDCAVKKGLDNGEVSQSRYKSYLQIIQGDDNYYRTDFW